MNCEIPQDLISIVKEAMFDPECEGACLKAPPVGIYFENKVVGFYSPRQEPNGKWRLGLLYISPKYRGRGLLFRTAKKFFEDREPALVPIRIGNKGSENLFRSLGFVPTGIKITDDTYWVGQWWEKK